MGNSTHLGQHVESLRFPLEVADFKDSLWVGQVVLFKLAVQAGAWAAKGGNSCRGSACIRCFLLQLFQACCSLAAGRSQRKHAGMVVLMVVA